MAEETIETDSEPYILPWYSKICEYIKNRNKIRPAKIEMDDCDFFIVGASRTIRVLRPSPKVSGYYEEQDEKINENFITKWAKRPHSSDNCRCSFRQPSNSPFPNFITTEINRIKTSLCEAEKIGENIDNIEDKILVKMNGMSTPITDQPRLGNVDSSICEKNSHDLDNKNKIIKDLEKYIDVLLEEVLNDTVKFMSDADNTLKRSKAVLLKSSNSKDIEKWNVSETIDSSKSSLDISFEFPADNIKANVEEIKLTKEGYINQGFDGTTGDPDCLEFDLGKPVNNQEINIDCVDSGINSVETVEFQPDSGLSLEQSLMEIIDEKFGRRPLENWKDLVVEDEDNKQENTSDNHSIKNQQENLINSENKNNSNDHEICKLNEILDSKINDSIIDLVLDDPIIENKFQNSRLELNNNSNLSTIKIDTPKKPNAVVVLCEKFTSKLGTGCSNGRENKSVKKKINNEPVEMRDYRATWKGFETPPRVEEISKDLVVYRKNRKPVIMFIHGFGSSADVFELQMEYFTQLGYSCIAPDILGHGMSSAPKKSREYHFDKLLNDLELVLQHYAFRPGQKCVLVAHNYGCSFATALACKYENFIHQLVLISGGGPTPLAPPSKEGPAQCCMRATLSPLLMCGLRRDILYSARGRQHPYCGIETEEQWPSHMPFILEGMIWPEGDYVFHRRISTPTLLIHGLKDNMVSLVQECQMERTMMKAFLEVLPNAGHMPMIECPEMCNHMINCFIDLWTKNKR